MIRNHARLLCILFLGMVPARAAQAEDLMAAVNLLRPDGLVGWDYGDRPPAGWTIAAGRLHGTNEATPLVSGFSFGQFELRFQWAVADGGCWKILLPEVPLGPGLAVSLHEGDGCGRIEDADQIIAPGRTLVALPAAMHTAVLRRAGAKLALDVDGRTLAAVEMRPERRFGLGLAISAGSGTLAELRAAEPAGQPLIRGSDLTDWWCPGNKRAWTVEKGVLVLSGLGGNYLRTEKEYANFTLALDYKVRKGGNSGIGIRTPRQGWPSGDGMELQILDGGYGKPLDEHSQMAIYGNVPPIARSDKSEDWNRLVIKADGWMISAWVNGELVQHFNTLHHPELKHRHLKGWIGVQDHGARIEIRDLRVLEAPEGTGLAAWQRPPAPHGAAALLDRLMNSERLSVADGVRSGAVTRVVGGDKKQAHLLAELTGPGAVVRIARSNQEGRLAFYFDGEETPRIEARPGALWQAVPQVAEDANPVVTFLAYRKSLKVVLLDAKGAQYRLDYVTFPPELPIESFRRGEPGIPRGWLSAVAYRHAQCWWGVHREHDPMPRYESPNQPILPGKTERLLHVAGSGIVLWTKLRANPKVLENDDLWLEATIDGEPQPAVAAPARYWFPGLAGQGNYRNFVMTDRGGPTNLLAMPFSNGITLSARNCGSKPIGAVGVTLSVAPAGEHAGQDIAGRMRLRGVFHPGGDEGSLFAAQRGKGRWVGLVYQQAPGTPSPLRNLLVDGTPAAGWSPSSPELFLGSAGEFRKCLSGRHGELCWRYLIPEAVDFQDALALEGETAGARLALFYVAK